MNTQTSLVAEQVRLQQWAEQIKECQNRPSDMKVDAWCSAHGITKANYYYRLRRVREACLEVCEPAPSFVELAKPTAPVSGEVQSQRTAAVLRCPGGVTVEIYNNASTELIRSIVGAIAYAQ